MKLIDRYIFKQVALAALLGLVTFIVMWISPEILFKIIKKTIDGQISPFMGLKLFFLEMPEILGTLIPASLMLGSIWVFDNLSKNSELTILRGIGVSFSRLVVSVVILGILGSATCFFTYQYLVPYSTSRLKILKEEVNKDNFVFVNKTKSGKPEEILIIGNYNGKNINNIKLFEFSGTVSDEAPLIKNIITADSAEYHRNFWALKNGINYEIGSDGVYKSIKSFKNINALSNESSLKAYKLLTYSVKKSKEMKLSELWQYFSLLKSVDMQDEARYMLTKYYQRFAQPFSCILFALCGVVLGFGRPREKRFVGFTMGAILIFLCLIIAPFIEMLSQTGLISPFIAAWIPNLIVLSTLLILIRHKQI